MTQVCEHDKCEADCVIRSCVARLRNFKIKFNLAVNLMFNDDRAKAQILTTTCIAKAKRLRDAPLAKGRWLRIHQNILCAAVAALNVPCVTTLPIAATPLQNTRIVCTASYTRRNAAARKTLHQAEMS